MLVVLPLVAFVTLFLVWVVQEVELRRAFIVAATAWGVLVTAITELLSIHRSLTLSNVATAWLLIVVSCVAWLMGLAPSWHRHFKGSLIKPQRTRERLDIFSLTLLCGVVMLVALVGLTAVLSPPNTGDAMTYHLPRVVMWISNRSARFYPTLDYAQLIFSPWAEYAMLHLNLLFGGDRFVNLVQWFSYAGITIAGSLIAQSLGADRRGQILAAVMCATIPVAILEASGAKNNCVVAFWIAVSVYFLLAFGKNSTWTDCLGFGCAAGLAILTKGTAYSFLPCLTAAGWWIGSPHARRLLVRRIPVVAFIVLALNGPLFVRNYSLTGSPLGVGFQDLTEDLDFGSLHRSPAGIVASALRNLATRVTISDQIDYWTARATVRAIRLLGQAPDNPDAIKLPRFLRFETNPLTAREDMAGAPAQLIFLILAFILLLWHWRSTSRELTIYVLGVSASFLVFCTLLRWERWGVRYQLPILVLEAVWVGVILYQRCSRPVAMAIGALAILTAAPFALLNQLRPLVPSRLAPRWTMAPWSPDSILTQKRSNLYFADLHENLMQSYESAALAINSIGCANIAVDASLQHYEYPLLALIDDPHSRPRIWYSGVYNRSADLLPDDHPTPCAVVCFGCANVKQKWSDYRSVGGRVSLYGDVAVFSAEGSLANLEDGVLLASSPPKVARQQMQLDEDKLISPGFGSLYYDVQQAVRRSPDRGPELVARLEAIDQLQRDGGWISLYSERLHEKAVTNRLSDKERIAVSAAAQALENLVADRPRKVEELRRLISLCHETKGNGESKPTDSYLTSLVPNR